MTVHSPQATAHGEVIEIRSQVAPAQVAPVDPLPAYYTPDTLIADLMDELAEGREMVAYLARANEALTAQLESTLKDRALIMADRDRLRAATDDVIRETFACMRESQEAYAAQLRAEAERDALLEDRELITACRICPSCRDSLDLPSGDGCANMPAHDPLGRIIPVNLEDL